MSARPEGRMPGGLKGALYVNFGVLWLTGGVWLVAHFGFPATTPFGPSPNPYEHPLMVTHGVLAATGLFLFGWLAATHISWRLAAGRRLASGLPLMSVAILLSISGYALYYLIDRSHAVAAVTHEVIGAASILFALVHMRTSSWRTRR